MAVCDDNWQCLNTQEITVISRVMCNSLLQLGPEALYGAQYGKGETPNRKAAAEGFEGHQQH